MFKLLLILINLSFVLLENPYHLTKFHSNRTGIVQLFLWPYESIARECENFLGPKGFAAVQVSSVHENRIIPNRLWYEIYQPISYKIKNRLGDENQFKNMIDRCNSVGVRILIDVVMNHMSDEGETLIIRGTAGSHAAPKLRLYPAVPYSLIHFHKTCTVTDWTNKTQMRNCQLLTLPDLNQKKKHVRSQLIKMLNKLIDLGVGGFRIDAASFMDPNDLKVIFGKMKNLNNNYGFRFNDRPFIYQEAHSFKYDYIEVGRIIEFSYAFFVSKAMQGDYPLKNYYNLGETWGLVSSNDAVVDIDNHDSQRSYDQLTYREPTKFRMATAFMLAYPYGVPKMISSFAYKTISEGPPMDKNENIIDPAPNENGKCQANWNCEHRYQGIAEMVQFANIVRGEEIKLFWANDDGQASFCRGKKGFIAFNTGKKDMDVELEVCLPSGTYCDIATGHLDNDECNWKKSCTGRQIVVNANGKARIKIAITDEQQFLAIHV